MRFSAALALCAAPLAFAGALQADILGRRDGHLKVENKDEHKPAKVEHPVAVNKQANVQVTEIIIIWVNNGGGAPTSTHEKPKDVATPPAAAATHSIAVGGTAGLVYTPNQIQAAVGDTVIFTFYSKNHTVTQSTFDAPCKALPGGLDSGFMPNANDSVVPAPQMAMQVTVATPIWFYCKQKTGNHCGKGMTFSINPTAEKTHAQFTQQAIAQNGTGAGGAITGGTPPPPAAPPAAAPPAAAPPAPAPPAAAPPAAEPPKAAPPAVAPPAGEIHPGAGAVGAGGACACSCLCGVSSFPSAGQGVGAYGGMSGALPRAMA